MTDRILVNGLVVYAYHGVRPEEQSLGQRFEIDMVCELDLRDAAMRDTAAATVSYASLVDIALEISAKKKFFLIEALADGIAQAVLLRYAQIERISVTIRKPSAPIPATLDHVAVEITRDQIHAGGS